MNRRSAVFGGAAIAAGLAGAGAAWWHTLGSTDASGADIWALRFTMPSGGELVLADLRGKPILLNFWATWCPPCVSELPLIDRFQRDQRARGWQVVGLAVDNPGPVSEFLAKLPVSIAIGLAGLEGVELSRKMGNTNGALPFSVVFDRRGSVVQRKLGVILPDDLQRWAATVG